MWAILAGLFSIGFALYDRAVQANYLKQQMEYSKLQEEQTKTSYEYNINQLETDKERLENVYQTDVENIQKQGVKVGKAQTASIAAMGFRVNPYQGLQEQQGETTAQVILNETYQNVQEDIDQLTQQYNYEVESINNQIDYYNDLLALLDENEETPTTPQTDNNEENGTTHELPPDIEENNNVNNPNNTPTTPRPDNLPEENPIADNTPTPEGIYQPPTNNQITEGDTSNQPEQPTIPEEVAPTSDDIAEAMGIVKPKPKPDNTNNNNTNNNNTITHEPPTDEQIAGQTTEDILMGNYTVAGYNDYINRGGNPNLTYEDYLTMIENISNKTLLTEKNKRVNSASITF